MGCRRGEVPNVKDFDLFGGMRRMESGKELVQAGFNILVGEKPFIPYPVVLIELFPVFGVCRGGHSCAKYCIGV